MVKLSFAVAVHHSDSFKHSNRIPNNSQMVFLRNNPWGHVRDGELMMAYNGWNPMEQP